MTNQTVVVEQVDRDAAAELYLSETGLPHSPHDRRIASEFRSGELDDWDSVQAFARHRLAERERCAKVARDEANRLREMLPTAREMRNQISMEYSTGGRVDTAIDIERAIRTGDPA